MARKYEEIAQSQGSDAQLQELAGIYELVNPLEIGLFLRRKPHVVKLLKEARQELTQFFPDSRVTIERYTDVDDNSGDCKMVVLVYPPDATQDVNATIGTFNKSWYIPASSRIRGDFCINYQHSSLALAENLWDDLIGAVEAPEDWSNETDHYVRGTPKRYSKVKNAG
jgi:hypothetical protein